MIMEGIDIESVDAHMEALHSCRDVQVTVIGDLMLDEYIHGAVSRISPEAPVPVMHASNQENRLGGAANVARQISELGAQVTLIGLIGNDEAGARIRELCTHHHIECTHIVESDSRITTRKLRFISQTQQMMRLDWENTAPLSPTEEIGLERAIDAIPVGTTIIVSDYAKGVLSEGLLRTLFSKAALRSQQVVVDPKHRDFTRYRGAQILTPNLRELSVATDTALFSLDEIERAAEALRAANLLDAIVVTLGDRGMLIASGETESIHIPAQRRDVYDVTGAGDTAIAVMTALLAAGTQLRMAARIANVAAGIAVGEVGAAAVSRSDIGSALMASGGAKLSSRAELASRIRRWQAAGKKVVFTNGCFDLLHSGHLSLLQFAKAQGDILVLAINSDAAIKRLKGPSRPVVRQSDRANMLAALSCVDAVVIFDEDTPYETLKLLQPDVLVKGQDYRPQEVIGRDIVEGRGGRLALAPLLPDYSTSSLIDRVRSKNSLAISEGALHSS